MTELQKWSQFIIIVILAAAVAGFLIRTYSQNLSRQALLVRVFAVDLVVIGVGIGAGSFFASGFPPIFAMIATGVLTFFGFIGESVHNAPQAAIRDRDIRIAIAASLTMMYVVVVGYGAWFQPGGEGNPIQHPISQELLTSFSTVVGTVIAFYFGTSAYLEGRTPAAHTPETETHTRT
jgi:hypothetical protein